MHICLRYLTLLILISTPLFSNYPDGSRRGNLSLIHLDSPSTSIIEGCVNAITGEFFQTTTDLQILGTETLSLERYLSDKLLYSYGHHHWVNYGFNFASYLYTDDCQIKLKEGNGALIDLQRSVKHRGCEEFNIDRNHAKFGVTNFSGDVIGRKNHLRYLKIFMRNKHKNGVVEYPTGTQKIYERIKIKGCHSENLLPVRENYPSGARHEYEYDHFYGISQVTLKARNGERLSSIHFIYPPKNELKNKPYFDVVASNGQSIRYHLKPAKKYSSFEIEKIEKSFAPNERIRVKTVNHSTQMVRVRLPDCRFREALFYHYGWQETRDGSINIKYSGFNPKNAEMFVGRVHKLIAPVGIDGNPVMTHQFVYSTPLFQDRETGELYSGKGSTTVYNAHSNKSCYHWNDHFQLEKIEKFNGTRNYTLYSTEYFRYDTAGQLTQRYFTTAKEGTLFCRQFIYNDSGDVVEDQLWGNLTGRDIYKTVHMNNGSPSPNGVDVYIKRHRYTNDRFHNLSYESDGFQESHYEYYPESNLLTAKFMGPPGKIEAREFYYYNERGDLIKKIADDGSSKNCHDFTNVTCRKIERRELSQGFPTEINILFMDLENRQELLSSRQRIRYSNTGKPLEEQYFDADGTHLYTIRKEYDAHDNLIVATDALGVVTTFTYDKNDNLILQIRKGIHKRNTYDCSNRLVKEEIFSDSDYQSKTSHYNYLSQITKSIDSWGQETIFKYDDFGRPISETKPSFLSSNQHLITPTVYTTYDALGNITKQITPSGYEIHSAYTLRGDLIHSWDQDGTLQRCEYSLNGLLMRKTERSGIETRYSHDFLGRVIEENYYDPQGNFIRGSRCTYKGGLKISELDFGGNETRYTYNYLGQCIRKQLGECITTYEYDAQGRIVREQTGDSVITTLYDAMNRIIENAVDGVIQKNVYDSNGNIVVSQMGENTTYTTYNMMGLPTQTTDTEGYKTNISYNDNFINSIGQRVRLITHTQPNGTQTELEHDTHGRIARQSVISPLGELLQQSASFYDSNGKLIETLSTVISTNHAPYIRKVCFQYDPQGRLTCLNDAADSLEQKIIRYHYNTLGQKVAEIQANSITLHYTYDFLGRLSSVDSSDGTVLYHYSYDPRDNLTQVYDGLSGSTTEKRYDSLDRLIYEKFANELSVSYSYNDIGKLTMMTLPDGSEIHYSYAGSLLRSVNRGDFTHCYLERNKAGKCISESLPNGDSRKTTYAPSGQKLQITTSQFNDTVLERDVSRNVTLRKLRDNETSYQWDDLHQMMRENTQSYLHDSVYNRTQFGQHQYTLNQLNQVIHDGENLYRYDLNGNLIEGRGMTFEYDGLNRLIKVSSLQGVTRYTYDAENRRMSTIGAETTHYYYFGMNELGSISPSSQQLRVLGDGEGAERGAGILFEIDGIVYIPLYDLAGNVAQLCDREGQVIQNYDCSIFGVEPEDVDGPPRLSPWRFSSKRVDTETGFVYFGHRYYDPTLGRWATADPQGYAAGPNLYAYVMNNPISHLDEYGLVAEPSDKKEVNRWGRDSRKTILIGKKKIVLGGLRLAVFEAPTVPDVTKLTDVKECNRKQRLKLQIADGHASVYSLGIDKEPAKYFIVFVNGMNNTLDEALESTQLISRAFGNINVYTIHNPTNGVVLDALSAGTQMANSYTQVCSHVERGLNHLMNAFPDKYCVNFSHSKGALISDRVFKRLSKENRRRIFSVSFGGAHIIKPKNLAGSMNFISSRDLIPYFCSPFESIGHAISPKDYISVIEGSGFYGLDHSFGNKTYQRGLKVTASMIDTYLR